MAAIFALIVSVAVLVLVGFYAPAGGPTFRSAFQGLVLMAVFAAPAIATLMAPERVLALGGAMFVAGAALLPGGNLIGILMVMPGVLLVIAGVTFRPALESPVWMRLIGNAAVLVLAVYLAISPGAISWLIAMGLAVGVTLANSRVTRPQASSADRELR